MTINKNNYEAYFLDYHEGTLSTQEVADLFLFLSEHPELRKAFEEFEHIVLEDFSSPVFENKDRLKKNITAENREDYFIRAVEGTLDPIELALLDQFLKTHPEFVAEFSLFQKTKLQANPSLILKNKDALKQGVAVSDDTLIAYLEGVLTMEEQVHLEKQLTQHAELQKTFNTYRLTQLIADTTILYPDKQALKRKERKVIPLYYYTASVAAALVLLLSIFFLFRTNNPLVEQRFAEQKTAARPEEQQKTEQSNVSSKKQTSTTVLSSSIPAVALKTSTVVEKKFSTTGTASLDTLKEDRADPLATETTPLTGDKQLAETTIPLSEKQIVLTPADSGSVPRQNNNVPMIAQLEKKPVTTTSSEFSSLSGLLSAKLKERFFKDENELAAEEKNSASKKLTGWDVAGMLAKGLSKITGKKIEFKPEYNEEGDLKAYALSAGKLEFSRVK
jgi:hypothetical protein